VFDERRYGKGMRTPESGACRPLLGFFYILVRQHAVSVSTFVEHYTPAERQRIAFAWNGKHATEFVDSNQDFRWSLVKHCLANPEQPSPELLVDLFVSDAEWSAEAWGAPQHFADLGALLLKRGGANAVVPFAQGFNRSFDTFGACHGLPISLELSSRLALVAAELAAGSTGPLASQLSATHELFMSLCAGTASQGWSAVAGGTPVASIRVSKPGPISRFLAAVSRAIRGRVALYLSSEPSERDRLHRLRSESEDPHQ